MKALILVCALVATSVAGPTSTRPARLDPKLAPQVAAAEQAWTTAEASPKQPELWRHAARAFDAVDGAPVAAPVKRDAAYAAILAWRNAVGLAKATADQPGLLAAIARYTTYADAADPNLPGVLFVEADTYRRFDQLDAAIPKLRAIIERYPRHEVAEYAAMMLLDAYNQLQRYDELVALANELAKDAAFLHGRDDLAHTVAMILQRSKRKRAEDLERAAHATKDWNQYVAAGTAYLDIYNADPEARENDEVLYNAGVCFEEGRALGEAIRMYSLIEKQYRTSRLAAKATARLARLYGDIAQYDKAATKLEDYAKRYAGEKDAYDALSDAVFFRTALGDRAKAIEDTNYFIKTFAAKKPVDAANASWSLTALYEADADKTIKHLREYLRRFGDKGGRDRVVIAHAKIGAALWKQSCPHALVDGLCVKFKDRAPRTCGTGTARTTRVTPRDARKRREALAEFALAVKEYDRAGGRFVEPRGFGFGPARGDGQLDPAARYYYAQAKLALADADLETYLAGAPRMTAPFDAALAAGKPVSAAYDAVIAIGDPATAITATARGATLAQALAGALVTSRPRSAASCDVITGIVEPLEARAVEGFAACLAKSTELSWFEASSASCEQQLTALKPDEFPPARERRSRPRFAAPVIALEPPLRR